MNAAETLERDIAQSEYQYKIEHDEKAKEEYEKKLEIMQKDISQYL